MADAVLSANACLRALQLGTDDSSTRTGGGGAYVAGSTSCIQRSQRLVAEALQASVAGYLLADVHGGGGDEARALVGPCVAGYIAESALAQPSLMEANLELAAEYFHIRAWSSKDAHMLPMRDMPGPAAATSFHHLLRQVRARGQGAAPQSLLGWAQAAWETVLVGGLHSSSVRIHRVLPKLLGGSLSTIEGASQLVTATVGVVKAAVNDFLGVSNDPGYPHGVVPLGFVRLLGTVDGLCSCLGALVRLVEGDLVPPLLRALRLCPSSCPEACVAIMHVLGTVLTGIVRATNEVQEDNDTLRAGT